jgi:hypothetical protein
MRAPTTHRGETVWPNGAAVCPSATARAGLQARATLWSRPSSGGSESSTSPDLDDKGFSELTGVQPVVRPPGATLLAAFAANRPAAVPGTVVDRP